MRSTLTKLKVPKQKKGGKGKKKLEGRPGKKGLCGSRGRLERSWESMWCKHIIYLHRIVNQKKNEEGFFSSEFWRLEAWHLLCEVLTDMSGGYVKRKAQVSGNWDLSRVVFTLVTANSGSHGTAFTSSKGTPSVS